MPEFCTTCTCQGHTHGDAQTIQKKHLSPLDQSCKLSQLDQLFRLSSRIPAGSAHSHLCPYSSHSLFVMSHFPSSASSSPVFISIGTFLLIHGAAWLHIKQRMDISLSREINLSPKGKVNSLLKHKPRSPFLHCCCPETYSNKQYDSVKLLSARPSHLSSSDS